MTVQASFHGERLSSPHQRHFVRAPMARFAAHAFVHMNAVVEIDELRKSFTRVHSMDFPVR